MKAKPRKKKSLGAWCPEPLTYAEWIELAWQHPDQNLVWRSHEFHARKNYREDPRDIDELGGEG